MTIHNKLIPENTEGQSTNTESHTDLDNIEQAKQFFELVKQRLFDVNNWHQLAGSATADFQLTDADGKPINRHPETGDYLRISLPAPGSDSGEGYDWVRIEQVVEKEAEAGLQVRPASHPGNQDPSVAHFFDAAASSSFIVSLTGKKVTAGVYGRNEKPNTDTDKLSDKIRNTAVAAGAMAGFAKIQWKSLVNGLVSAQ